MVKEREVTRLIKQEKAKSTEDDRTRTEKNLTCKKMGIIQQWGVQFR